MGREKLTGLGHLRDDDEGVIDSNPEQNKRKGPVQGRQEPAQRRADPRGGHERHVERGDAGDLSARSLLALPNLWKNATQMSAMMSAMMSATQMSAMMTYGHQRAALHGRGVGVAGEAGEGAAECERGICAREKEGVMAAAHDRMLAASNWRWGSV